GAYCGRRSGRCDAIGPRDLPMAFASPSTGRVAPAGPLRLHTAEDQRGPAESLERAGAAPDPNTMGQGCVRKTTGGAPQSPTHLGSDLSMPSCGSRDHPPWSYVTSSEFR